MARSEHKCIEGTPAAESTAVTLRSIKEILHESGAEDLLLSSDQQDTPDYVTQDDAVEPENDVAEQPPLAKRLTSRIFGG